jgi:hypothetical protein
MENSIMNVAQSYLKRGWSPIPLPTKSKIPILENWQNLNIKEQEIPKFFNGKPQNISVLLGKPSGWLVDVDIDSFDSLKIAEILLPKTDAVFGRKSKPKSHYLFVCEDAKTEKFQFDSMLVEIRSTGCQTVFPDSIHPSGERIFWEKDGVLTKIDFASLRKSVGILASVTVLSTFWTRGNRHELALAISGLLLKNSWSIEDVTSIIKAVCHLSNDEELADRLQAIVSTAEKIRLNQSVVGFFALEKLISSKALGLLKKWLQIETKFENENQSVSSQTEPSKTTADKLIKIGQSAELWTTPDGKTFASFTNHKGQFENCELKSEVFRQWLELSFWQKEKKVAGSDAIKQSVSILSSLARYEGDSKEVFTRIAHFDDKFFLDLCNQQRTIAEVSKNGWKIVTPKDVPVRFRRSNGMLALPEPIPGGDINLLRQFINVENNDDFILILSWLVSALRGNAPKYPILSITGEQGSAKSTTSLVLRQLIDPNVAPLRMPSKEIWDLCISANNSWVVCLNNLSSLDQNFSDALCCIVEGGGLPVRSLYTTDEETIFKLRRPIILNGITDVATRPDLLDRSICLHLPSIPEEKRQEENEFLQLFEQLRSQILGALLTSVCAAMRNFPNTELKRSPRMADFARWSVAAEVSLGFEQGSFMNSYERNRETGNAVAIENSPIAMCVIRLMQKESFWEGTATELLEEVRKFADEEMKKTRDFPKASNHLSKILSRIAPILRKADIDIKQSRNRKGSNFSIKSLTSAR